jgi:hypothetical protein
MDNKQTEKPKFHLCYAPDDTIDGINGQAVEQCWEVETGHFWVGNGEYSNTVTYCPFCGKQATIKTAVANNP